MNGRLDPVFFTDRDLGHRFPEILAAAGLAVERHKDHFAHDCADEAWLQSIGQRGWVALTHDSRIRYHPNELEAVMRHKVALLVIVGRASYSDLANAFVMNLPRIQRFLVRNSAPFIGKVYRPPPSDAARKLRPKGRVELWYPR